MTPTTRPPAVTARIPCGRLHRTGRTLAWCREGSVCPWCATLIQQRAAMLAVADSLDCLPGDDDLDDLQRDIIARAIGRLRGEVARTEGRT